jgi:hypothetical protein
VDLADWNQSAGHHWNRLVQDIRRTWGQHVEYFRAVEVQKRGALHLHVLVRLGRGQVVDVVELRKLAMAHGFGHEVRCDPVRDGGGAGYVAKYVSKAVGDRCEVPWRRVDVETGEISLRASYRCWSSSRHWGQSMASLLVEQREWVLNGGAGGSGAAGPCGAACGAAGCGALAPKAPLDSYSQRYTRLHSLMPVVLLLPLM